MSRKKRKTPLDTVSRNRKSKSSATIGRIGGFMLVLIVIILFVATRGRSNEMMYVTLLFVILAIAFFTYGYWSSVFRGEGVWQYTGSHNLQHQQVSNPNYHFGPDYRGHPNSKMHLCAPPKMGGAKLEIYTLAEDEMSDSMTGNHHHHHHHHHHHKNHENGKSPPPLPVSSYNSLDNEQPLLPIEPIRSGHSCIDLNFDQEQEYEKEPVKCEVNLSRSVSHHHHPHHHHHHHKPHHHEREGFAEVQLPPLR